MTYLLLFYEFLKIGLFAVGGGLATIPFLYDLAEKTNWFTSSMVADMIAISESTPGPLGVNMATYAGFQVGGVAGGIIATLGLVAPSMVIVMAVANFLRQFRESAYVQAAFYGLRPAVTGLIAAAGLGVIQITLLSAEQFQRSGMLLDIVQWKAAALAILLYISIKRWKLHTVVYIAASAILGVVFQFSV